MRVNELVDRLVAESPTSHDDAVVVVDGGGEIVAVDYPTVRFAEKVRPIVLLRCKEALREPKRTRETQR